MSLSEGKEGERKEGERKRSLSEVEGSAASNLSPSGARPQLNVNKTLKVEHKSTSVSGKSIERWRPHGVTEDYVNIVGEIMYPKSNLGPYGFDAENGRFPMEKINTLGILTCILRKPTVVEKWSPYEVAVFEAAITLNGKNFHAIQKYVKTKTTKEVIEFYYDWKKTSHYKEWKKNYISDDRETAVVYAD
ncbi:hypothetical protein B484DRAFT_449989 [Ochromonadaceae sp. CCMP2298]|nr:hypothetical protein B484DRAFT_449989 [Ochromonadaceae sp. CCMP2298]|mmetsp:Transcript_33231/g.74019  ORF Transcript_33231/g.74019 Transcript_33231/m.74019 type:complete len:190 (-) Transcript_33231:47-616(-)